MRSRITGGKSFVLIGLGLVQACGGVSNEPAGGRGGATGSGGSSSGGAPSASGGSANTGGKTAGAGGVVMGGFTGVGGKAKGGAIGAGGQATGGTSASGGQATGGTSASGGQATGGTSGQATGGTSGSGGASARCEPSSSKGECQRCVQTKCCAEWLACGDDVACSTRPNAPGEIVCIQSCLIDSLSETGVADIEACARACAEDSSGVSVATSDLVACIRSEKAGQQACSVVCFGTEL